jgi:hypothetical protein
MFIWTAANPDRDSDLDNGIIHHEYGHGVSNRLTGGPANSNALNNTQSGGMGEGWSDFYALMFTQRPTDTQNGSYPIGGYSNNSTGGIRAFPYSFNMAVNPLMFDSYGSGTVTYSTGNLARSTAVHRTGTVWASALWDLNWLLINKYGYDADLMTGWNAAPGAANAGNKLTLRLVNDAMKLQPANPSFTQARDAILAADTALTGGANHLQIWQAMARRGLGENVAVGSSSSTATIVADTAIPAAAQTLQVLSYTPAALSVTATAPTSFTLTFTDALDAASITANDFTVNGITATAVNHAPGSTTATFTFASSPVTTQGLQVMTLAANAVNRVSDAAGNLVFSGSFRFDTTTLSVTSTTPINNSSAPPPLTTIDLNFNEAIAPASISTFDLVLSRGFATAVTLVNGGTTARFTVTGLSEESTLSVNLPAGAITDTFGNPSAAYAGTLQIDHITRALPTLTAVTPLGSTVYDGSMTGRINTTTDGDDFTITLDAGQTITATIDPDAALRPRITILSPTNSTLATATASSNGQTIAATAPVATAGTYTLRVQSSNNTTGNFAIRAVANAAIESESLTGIANNTTATAQDLTPASTTIATSLGNVRRWNALGTTDASTAYTASAISATFEDISATGTAVLINADDVNTSINIPFAFNFYGVDYSTVFFSDNGLITFGSGTSSNTNGSLSTSPSQAAIAVLWDDLETGSDGVKWQVLGSAGNRRLVIQWDNVRYWTSSGAGTFTLNFQAVLFEGSNIVQLNYDNLAGNITSRNEGASATVGIKNGTSTATLLLSQNTAGSTFHGSDKSTRISPPGSAPDFYRITAAAGERISVAATSLTTGTPTITLLASDGTTILGEGVGGPTNLGLVIDPVTIPAAGNYFIAVTGPGGMPYSLNVLTGLADRELNDTAATAQALGNDRTVSGYVSNIAAADNDWFALTLPAGTDALRLETARPGDGTGQFANTLDPVIRLYDAAGSTLLGTGTNLDGDLDDTLSVTGLTAGATYAIRITGAGNTAGEYILNVQPFQSAPFVESVIINDGDSQRSRVLEIEVAFSTEVSIAAGAFSLTNGTATLTSSPGGGIVVGLVNTFNGTVATLTFTNDVNGVDTRSLADGIWTLTVFSNSVAAISNGTPMTTNFSQPNIRRLQGDHDANNTVDGSDLTVFGNLFGTGTVAFDFNDDGTIDGADLIVMGNRFGAVLS